MHFGKESDIQTEQKGHPVCVEPICIPLFDQSLNFLNRKVLVPVGCMEYKSYLLFFSHQKS